MIIIFYDLEVSFYNYEAVVSMLIYFGFFEVLISGVKLVIEFQIKCSVMLTKSIFLFERFYLQNIDCQFFIIFSE